MTTSFQVICQEKWDASFEFESTQRKVGSSNNYQ